MSNRRGPYYKPTVFGACVLIVLVVAAIGGIFTGPGAQSEWYEARRHEITPPGYVFSVVWTALFFLIALSLYFSWTNAPSGADRRNVAIAFGANFVLNAAWSALYFGLHLPIVALIDLAALWLSILVIIAITRRIDPKAAYLLVPYLLWVAFAGVLNWLSR